MWSSHPLRREDDWFGSLAHPAQPRPDRDEEGNRIGFCDQTRESFEDIVAALLAES